MQNFEIRSMKGTLTSEGNSLTGQAAPYYDGTRDTEYNLQDNIYERYTTNCFHLNEQIPICFNHDEERIFGIAPTTAKVWIDERGLQYSVPDLPDTSYVRDMKALIKNGTMQGSSVRMVIEKDQWKREGTREIRSIEKATIYHVSPVFLPAYAKTKINLRSWEHWKDEELMEIYEARLNKLLTEVVKQVAKERQ